MSLKNFISSFELCKIITSEENFSSLNLTLNNIQSIDKALFIDSLENLSNTLYGSSFKIYDSNKEYLYIVSTEENFNRDTFEKLYTELVSDINLEELVLSIAIYKPPFNESYLRIFSLDYFLEYLNSVSLNYLYCSSFFNLVKLDSGCIYYILCDEPINFKTHVFHFINHNEYVTDLNKKIIDSNKLIKSQTNIKEVSKNLNYISNLSLFHFLEIDNETFLHSDECYIKLQKWFYHHACILSLISLSNYSNIEPEFLFLKIKGYRDIEIHVNSKTLLFFPDIIEIVKWIFMDENYNEKINLARNIITLDYNSSLSDINHRTKESIKSNFELYLKKNTQTYLDMRIQILDKILDSSLKVESLNKDFIANFKNSCSTVFGFILTSLIINVIQSNSLTINNYLSIIFILLIVVSFTHLIISLKDYELHKKNIDTQMTGFKEYYSKFLTKVDLENLLEDNKIYQNSLIISKKILFMYTILWCMIISASFIIGMMLNPNIRNFIKLFFINLIRQ